MLSSTNVQTILTTFIQNRNKSHDFSKNLNARFHAAITMNDTISNIASKYAYTKYPA